MLRGREKLDILPRGRVSFACGKPDVVGMIRLEPLRARYSNKLASTERKVCMNRCEVKMA